MITSFLFDWVALIISLNIVRNYLIKVIICFGLHNHLYLRQYLLKYSIARVTSRHNFSSLTYFKTKPKTEIPLILIPDFPQDNEVVHYSLHQS